jgi:hypothetical protein
MSTINTKLLKQILSIQSDTGKMDKISEFIVDYVFSMGLVAEVDRDGNLYVKKGSADVFPTIVAHMDTVHRIVPDSFFKVVQADDILLAIDPVNIQPRGIGGDDKVGIFIALQLLTELKSVKVAFFVDEEIGCVGSGAADMSFFKDSSFVLQADRKGSSDFVRTACGTELYSDAFGEAIAPFLREFGFTPYDAGSLTDVYELKSKGLAVSCANVSAGYYNPHTNSEMVSISDVANTLNLFRMICKNLSFRKWKHKVDKVRSTRRSYSYKTWNPKTGMFDARQGSYDSYWKEDAAWERALSKPASFPKPKVTATVADVVAADRDTLLERAAKMKAEVIEKYLPESEGDSYMNGFDDDETDRSLAWNRSVGICPMCKGYDCMNWDSTEENFFCMVCQDYIPTEDTFGRNDTFGDDWPPKAIITGKVVA